jgi:biotin--protein ligase
MILRFATANLNKQASGPEFAKVFDALEQDDKLRVDFFKACLMKLGLQVNQAEQSVPSLSRLHLSSILPTESAELVSSLEEAITKEGDEEYIKGENDTFLIEKPERWSMGALKEAISGSAEEKADDGSSDSILDYNSIIKRIIPHEQEWPSSKETPYFNHHAYFANLTHYIQKTNGTEGWFGKHLLYGEVVTSTSTMLEK